MANEGHPFVVRVGRCGAGGPASPLTPPALTPGGRGPVARRPRGRGPVLTDSSSAVPRLCVRACVCDVSRLCVRACVCDVCACVRGCVPVCPWAGCGGMGCGVRVQPGFKRGLGQPGFKWGGGVGPWGSISRGVNDARGDGCASRSATCAAEQPGSRAGTSAGAPHARGTAGRGGDGQGRVRVG